MPFELLHIGESVSVVSSIFLGFIPSQLYISGSKTVCLITYTVKKINGKITYRPMPCKKCTLFRNHSTIGIYSALTFNSNLPVEMKKLYKIHC
jgi:hypothetical protein